MSMLINERTHFVTTDGDLRSHVLQKAINMTLKIQVKMNKAMVIWWHGVDYKSIDEL